MKNLYLLFLSLFLLPLVFPYFGSLDVIAPQWLFLGFYNLFLFIYFFRYPILIPRVNIFYIYSLFIIQVIISLIYSNNLNVSIVDSSRFLIVFFTIYNIYYLLSKGNISFKQISFVISFFLIIEVLYSIYPLFLFFVKNDISVYNNFSSIYSENLFIGFAGNKNITAASIAIKVPFFFYVFLTSNKKSILYFSLSFTFLILCSLFLLKARSVFVSFSFVLLCFFTMTLYFKKFRFLLTIPIIALSFLFVTFLISQKTNPVLNDIKSISFNAASSSDRFLLWDNAISYISQHPILGCGIGNWKIESIPYWKTHLSNYIVPYHAHNDFLEVTTELGLLGGFTYLAFFFSVFISLFFLFFKHKNDFVNFNQVFTVFCAFSVYTIDALLNFPNERTRMQIIFAVLISLVMILNNRKKII